MNDRRIEPKDIGYDTPIPTTPLDRALSGQAIAADSFARKQTTAFQLSEIPESAFEDWVSSLPVGDIPNALSELHAIADEHIARAGTARSMANAAQRFARELVSPASEEAVVEKLESSKGYGARNEASF